jgi:hypothetical protein
MTSLQAHSAAPEQTLFPPLQDDHLHHSALIRSTGRPRRAQRHPRAHSQPRQTHVQATVSHVATSRERHITHHCRSRGVRHLPDTSCPCAYRAYCRCVYGLHCSRPGFVIELSTHI